MTDWEWFALMDELTDDRVHTLTITARDPQATRTERLFAAQYAQDMAGLR